MGQFCGIILYRFVPSGFFRDDFLINGVFKVIGKGFLRAMQMLVVPLVFVHLFAVVWQLVIRKNWVGLELKQ